jgi:hypothetical protein
MKEGRNVFKAEFFSGERSRFMVLTSSVGKAQRIQIGVFHFDAEADRLTCKLCHIEDARFEVIAIEFGHGGQNFSGFIKGIDLDAASSGGGVVQQVVFAGELEGMREKSGLAISSRRYCPSRRVL